MPRRLSIPYTVDLAASIVDTQTSAPVTWVAVVASVVAKATTSTSAWMSGSPGRESA